MPTDTTELKKYELLLIFSPDLSEKDFEETLDDIKKTIGENSKGVKFEDRWGLRPFAYRIKKFDQGYYAVLYFEASPEAILEIRTNVRLQPRILRHLLITLPAKYEPKSLRDIELTAPKPRLAAKPEKRRMPIKPPETKEVVKEIMEETPSEKLLSGKTEEEKLKSLDKTLESILENPDINIS